MATVERIDLTRLPPCVRCRQVARDTWNGRSPEAVGGAPPPRRAAFLVTVGRSQIERFECADCQAITQNPIKVRFAARD